MEALNLITRVEGMIIFDPNQNEIFVQQINSSELTENVLNDIMSEISSQKCPIFIYKNYLITVESLITHDESVDAYLAVIGNENANDILLADFAANLSSCITNALAKGDLANMLKPQKIQNLYLLFDEAVVNGFIIEPDPNVLYHRTHLHPDTSIQVCFSNDLN